MGASRRAADAVAAAEAELEWADHRMWHGHRITFTQFQRILPLAQQEQLCKAWDNLESDSTDEEDEADEESQQLAVLRSRWTDLKKALSERLAEEQTSKTAADD